MVNVFDAAGLGLFCVTGALKALEYGLGPVPAALMGMVTGIGGGMARDLLAGRVPVVFSSELYATPALLGAAGRCSATSGLRTGCVAGRGVAALLRLAGAGDPAQLARPGPRRRRDVRPRRGSAGRAALPGEVVHLLEVAVHLLALGPPLGDERDRACAAFRPAVTWENTDGLAIDGGECHGCC